jgi:hypothetical protein
MSAAAAARNPGTIVPQGDTAPGFRFAHPGYGSLIGTFEKRGRVTARPKRDSPPAKSVKHFFCYKAKYFL